MTRSASATRSLGPKSRRADYDWVVLCQLYGTMMDLPKGWPMYCRDVKQLCDSAWEFLQIEAKA